MANASRDVDTRYREDFDYEYSCAAGQTMYKGTMVGINAAGDAGTPSATFARIVGILYLRLDDRQGVNSAPEVTVGGERIQVREGCHRMAQNGTITKGNVGQIARILDDQTVGLTGGLANCGVIKRVDADGYVWIDFSVHRWSLT